MDPSVIRCGAAPPGISPMAPAHSMPHSDPISVSSESEDRDADAFEELVVAAPQEPARVACTSLDDTALAELIARVMRQDEAAMALLYEQLSGRVYAVAVHITRQVAAAEEVLQDTFWQVWRQAPRFDAKRGTAAAWVLTLARSRALDAARAMARDPVQRRGQSIDDEFEPADASNPDPMDILQAVRRDSALHAQLAALDPLRRQLISLAFFKGMTHDEIAQHTGLPLGTVKSHVRRALSALHATLGPESGFASAGSAR